MTDFPTVGLKVDLTGLAQGRKAYADLKAEIADVGKTADATSGKVQSSAKRIKGANAEAGASATTRARASTKAASDEAKAEAQATREKERQRRYLMQVRIRSLQMEEAARAAAAAEEARQVARRLRDAERAARDQERLARQASKAVEDEARRAAAQAERSAKQKAAALAKAERDITRVNAAEVRKRQQAERQAAQEAERNRKYLESVRINSARMESRAQAQAEKERERAAREAARTQLQEERRLARERAALERSARRGGGGAGGGGGGGGFGSSSSAGPGSPVTRGDIFLVEMFKNSLGGLRHGLTETRRLFLDVRTAIGVFLAGMVVSPVLQMADAMTALRARAAAFTDQASDVPYLMEAIFEAAQRSRSPLESIATLYTRLAPLAKQLGKSQLELLRISETVAKGFQIGGATPEEAKSSAQQLAQALASNRLGGDELRSLAENAPILMAKIAQALNMNTGQFIKWAHEGKANAAVVVGALQTAQADIDRLFEKFPVTISQSVTLVKNALANMVGKVNEATGASQALALQISKFADFLQAESTVNAVAAAVTALGKAFMFAGQSMKLIIDYLPAIAAGILAIVAAAAATKAWTALMRVQTVQLLAMNAALVAGQIPLAAMPARLTAAALAGRLLGASMVAVRAAFLAVFTPVNILVGVLAAVAIGINAVNNATKAARNVFKEYDQSVIASSSALQRAIDLTDAYGGNSAKLNAILDEVVGTVDDRVDSEGRMDAAANRRLKMERLMAEAALTTAAADARAAASAAQRQATILGIAEPVRGFFEKFTPASKETRQRAADAAAQRARDRAALNEAVALQTKLANSLDAARTDLRSQPLRATKPDQAGPATPATAKPGDKGGGKSTWEGAMDQIARMRAEVEGLQKEIDNLSANPLSALNEQIIAAGNEAAARMEGGDKQNAKLAAEARTVAMQKERLQIIKQMIAESAKNQTQLKQESDGYAVLASAQERSTDIVKDFWASGGGTYDQYADALARSRDVMTEAQIVEAQLGISRRYGVDSLDQISDALVWRTNAERKNADAVQASAIAEAEAAEAAIRRKAALDAIASKDQDFADFNETTFSGLERALDHMSVLADNLGESLARGFGRGGRAAQGLLRVVTDYQNAELSGRRRIAEARAKYDKDGKRSVESLTIERQVSEELAQARIQGYAEMAGAAKGFFKEGTTGYKVLEGAEKAFRLYEFAMSAKSIVVKAAETAAKIGFFGAQAQAAAAAGAANMFATLGPLGFAAVAAMVAVLAGFGLSIAGGGGSKSPRVTAEQRQARQGTGTVLGDSAAKSASIARSLEIVAANTNEELEFSNGMLTALQSIDAGISRLTAALARQLGVGGFLNPNVDGLGSSRSGPSALATLAVGGPVGLLLSKLPVIGGIITALFGKKTTTSLADTGLQFGGDSLGGILSGGVTANTYQDLAIQTKKKAFGITYSNKTRYETRTGAVDQEILSEINRVIASLREGVLTAAGILGVEGAAAALDAMQVNLGKISFKDMTGEQIQEALQAIFSALGDDMAATALPALEEMQKAGEGAFETLARVARNYQVLDVSLSSIGLTFGAVGVASLKARERLIEMAGGIDALAGQIQKYGEDYLTEAERMEPIITAVYTELGKLGAGSIKTKDEFKALVNSLDLTTTQGAATFATLMRIAPAFAQIVGYMDELKTPTEKVAEAQEALNDAYETANDLIQETRQKWLDFVEAFARFRQELEVGALAANSPQDQYLKTKALFESTRARALAGDEKALGELQSVSEAYLNASRDYYAGTEPYFKDLAAVKTAAEQAQVYAQTQVDKADQQLAALNLMVSGLLTLNNSILTIPAAVAAVQTAIEGLAGAQATQSAALAAAVAAAVAAVEAVKNQPVTPATPTTPSTPANDNAAWTATGYLANNPDIVAAGNSLLATADRNSPWFREHGLDQGLEGFARWHYENQGIGEGRKWAAGGAFGRGGNVIDIPTAFNRNWLAEEAPEAIMPLARSASGELGVKVTGAGGDSKPVVEALQGLTRAVQFNTAVAQDGHRQTIAAVKELVEEQADGTAQARRQPGKAA